MLRPHRIAVGLYERTSDGLQRLKRLEIDVVGERTEVEELRGVAERLLLGLHGRHQGACGRSLPVPARGVVARQLGVDLGRVGRTQGEQALEQGPAQVGVDRKTRGRRSVAEPAAQHCDVLGGARRLVREGRDGIERSLRCQARDAS